MIVRSLDSFLFSVSYSPSFNYRVASNIRNLRLRSSILYARVKHEKSERAREREKSFNEESFFGLCKHLPKGVVYLCNDNCNTLMCRVLSLPPSTSFIWMSRSFSLSTTNIFHRHSFWSSVLLNQQERKV